MRSRPHTVLLLVATTLLAACAGGGGDDCHCPDASPGTDTTTDTESETGSETESETADHDTIDLPEPSLDGGVSLEQALAGRSSVREYTGEPLTLEEISQLLWAAQGVTRDDGKRTAPSAGAIYPMEIYLASHDRLLHYLPDGHRAEIIEEGDVRSRLAEVAQTWVAEAMDVFVITAVFARTEAQYLLEGERYVVLEAGHVAQNILLQAVALGLGAVPVGSFDDAGLIETLGLPHDHEPLYLVPVGHPAE